ncbi:Clavaminate synthase-like protein [Aureobasidium pullulans]|uniref:Clavaminate synthase-like protein n=1 Tax=Aureobasidium pullulans TaxID=5580 RepID=A0A4V4JVJ1_AURPU|nr:Clavaminate synthase-like protein [Aureobasidium pullulans]
MSSIIMAGSNVTSSEARRAAQSYLNNRLTTKTDGPARPFNVPVIDISSTFNGSLQDKQAVAAQIQDACTNSGFFQITGHNVPESVRKGVLNQASRFFKQLPPAQKDELHVKHSDLMRGWEPSDYTYVNPDDWATAAVPETKEGFNWGYEASLDPTGGDGKYLDLDGKTQNGNVWPAEDALPGFKQDIADYYGHVLELARHLFRLFALSLALPENHFDEMMTHPGGISRLLYYPPTKDPKPLDPKEMDKEVGLGAHTDYECFTLLLSSTTHGLEILTPDNVWTAATAVEGSFIVNVADFLMRWTNGVYKSTIHRVVNRTTQERYSVPFFFSINYDQLVETLPSCVSAENPSKYPPIRAGEYVLERLKATVKDG